MRNRFVVWCSVVALVLTSLPIGLLAAPPSPPRSTVTTMDHLIGPAALWYLRKRYAKHPRFAKEAARRRALMIAKGFTPLDDKIVVFREIVQKATPTPQNAVASLIGRLKAFFMPTLEADCYVSDRHATNGAQWMMRSAADCGSDSGGGETVFYPYCGGPTVTVFDNYTADYNLNIQQWVSGSFDDGNPSGTLSIWHTLMYGPQAQYPDSKWKGIYCGDQQGIAEREARDAIQVANDALIGAILPCATSNLAWFGCMGISWVGFYLGDILVQNQSMYQTCMNGEPAA